MGTEKLRVDFGGGISNKYEGFKKCDILSGYGIDYGGCDFNRDPLPFLDDSIDEGVSSHTLEHIENVRHFLNELHRVIKKGSKITFIVPYGLWPGSCKPVHKQMITECWFDFLRNHTVTSVYGFQRWDILKLELRRNKNNEIYEILCELTPIKEN